MGVLLTAFSRGPRDLKKKVKIRVVGEFDRDARSRRERCRNHHLGRLLSSRTERRRGGDSVEGGCAISVLGRPSAATSWRLPKGKRKKKSLRSGGHPRVVQESKTTKGGGGDA